jgi:hypothetical protein
MYTPFPPWSALISYFRVKQLHLLLRAIAHKKPQRKELKPGARSRSKAADFQINFRQKDTKSFPPGMTYNDADVAAKG